MAQKKSFTKQQAGVFIPQSVLSIFGFIGVFFIGGLCMYGVLRFSDRFFAKSTSSFGLTPQAEKTNTVSQTSDDVQIVPDGRDVYRNEALNISVAYPKAGKDVTIKEHDKSAYLCGDISGSLVSLWIYRKGESMYGKEPLFGGDLLFSIFGFTNDTNMTAREWIQNNCANDFPMSTMAALTVKGGDSVRVYDRRSDKRMLVGLNTGSKLYLFYGFSTKDTKEPETIFADMLNSFQYKH